MKITNTIIALILLASGFFYYHQSTKVIDPIKQSKQAIDPIKQSKQAIDPIKQRTGKLLKDYWILKERHHIAIPEQIRDLDLSACIMLQYDINEQGRFENPVILGHVAAELLKDELIASMEKWRWEPTEQNAERQPIRWFRYYGVNDNDKMRDECFSYHKIT